MKYTLLCLALLFCGTIFGQREDNRSQRENFRQDRQERIETLKIAYITKEINLTAEESKVFWPVYNKYQEQLKELRQPRKGKKDHSQLTDAEAAQLIDDHIRNEFKRAEIHEQMVKELQPIIGNKRIITLFKVEARFKKEILDRAGNRKDKRGSRPMSRDNRR